MTIAAGAIAKRRPVRVIFDVAASALHGCRSILSIGVTFLTRDLLVSSSKRELTHRVVVESQVSTLEARLPVALRAGDPVKLVFVRGTVAPHAVPRLRSPAIPFVTIETAGLLVSPAEWPARGLVIENRAVIEAGRGVALLTDAVAKNTGGMRVLMARHAPRDRNGAKLAFAEVTLFAFRLLVTPRKGKTRLLLVIEAHARVQILPIVAVVAALALIQVGLRRGTVIGPVAGFALGTRAQIAVPIRLGPLRCVALATGDLAVRPHQGPPGVTMVELSLVQGRELV